MKGLLKKDFFVLVKQLRFFLLIVLMGCFLPGSTPASFCIVYSSMLPITTMAYDERSKWDRLAAMMPYSTRDLVVSKYVLGYLGMGLVTLLSFGVQWVTAALRHTDFGMENIIALLSVCMVGLLIQSVNLPLMFYMGVEKGRLFFMVGIAALVAAGLLLPDGWTRGIHLSNDSFLVFFLIALAAIAVINILSSNLAVVLYRRKRA